ncbi:TlpA disulfide reductase family protein [uncultured Prevotella sp.]|uniref:TlpA family protein disulfide reductase n=1 Tax=uncultured Prevotella sp. TaxID=159272 RepID=UPI002582DBA0|nr:TlpA disulfide reductase family protein [uncultured Prevotella sp.]
MKSTIITILLALIATTGWAQKNEKIWDNVVIGNTNVDWSEVTKVGIFADRTEVGLRIKYRQGSWISIAKSTFIEADGKQYPIKDATVIGLDNRYTLSTNSFDFTLIFEPVPQQIKTFDVIEPGGWEYRHLRNADDLPDGITDTYWRNEATGEWLIGFTANHVVYNNKVWNIVSQTKKKDAYSLMLAGGLTIKVDKQKKGKRNITIGNGKPFSCSPITKATLPDYPTKDLRTGFVDNGYNANDSVTIIGWLKDMPERAWKQSSEFEVSIDNIFTDDQQKFYAKMDSLGRFTLKMPILNSSQVYLDWGRTSKSTLLEPGKTYFFLNDFTTGQQLFMGEDARVQNELLAYPDMGNQARIEENQDAMQFKAQMDSICNAMITELEERINLRPNLSQRYIDYIKGSCLTGQGESMMQARYDLKCQLPKEYMDFVTTELWQKAPKPYTLYRPFSTFMRDYFHYMSLDDYTVPAGGYMVYVNDALIPYVLRKNRVEGKVSISDAELDLLNRYATSYKAFLTTQFKARVDAGATTIDDILNIDSVAVEQFQQQDWVLQHDALLEREDIVKVLQDEAPFFENYKILQLLDKTGTDPTLRDIELAHYFYSQIDQTRKPLAPAMIELFEQQVHLPAALALVNSTNDKYVALERSDFANATSLRPSSDVEGMSDGEKIFRKIIEPYKGRIIYLDIWGTWCSPCKSNLKESWKVKEALKDYDIVYLYLCNRSSDESWKNVIKEYNLTGDNCVHYNLPEDQQAAIERYVGISGYPTYKLIDKEGNIHDLHWLHADDMQSFLETIDKMSK